MSAKKSFDLEANKPARRKRAKPARSRPEPRRSRKKTLRERREDAQGVKNMLVLVLGLGVIGGLIYLLWRPEIRITRVEAETEELKALASETMAGAYYAVIPRDSFFFYPEKAVKAAVLAHDPEIASVTVSRDGFDAIAIETKRRASAIRWCGTPSEAPSGLTCYDADQEGLLFKMAVPEEEGAEPMLRLYADLAAGTSTDTYPLRSTVAVGKEPLRMSLKFVETVQGLSVPVRALSIRGDEADLFTPEGTRVTYVIGKEREASESARATFSKLNLRDGSIEYVDLRFGGKVYIKRAGE